MTAEESYQAWLKAQKDSSTDPCLAMQVYCAALLYAKQETITIPKEG